MSSRKGTLAVLCMALTLCTPLSAQKPNSTAIVWSLDPSTGLMWAAAAKTRMTWHQAHSYCSTMNVEGYSVWRLPSLTEISSMSEEQTVLGVKHDVKPMGDPNDPDYEDISRSENDVVDWSALWTSDTQGTKHGIAGESGFHKFVIGIQKCAAFCVRTMEPDLLALAQKANVGTRVPDLQTLKAYVPLQQAKLAYQAARYQDTITQAQAALAIEPNLNLAYWAIGIAYARLGQWDEAISNLQTELKIDKDDGDAKSALKWAEASQKASKGGDKVKESAPVWN